MKGLLPLLVGSLPLPQAVVDLSDVFENLRVGRFPGGFQEFLEGLLQAGVLLPLRGLFVVYPTQTINIGPVVGLCLEGLLYQFQGLPELFSPFGVKETQEVAGLMRIGVYPQDVLEFLLYGLPVIGRVVEVRQEEAKVLALFLFYCLNGPFQHLPGLCLSLLGDEELGKCKVFPLVLAATGYFSE